MQIGELGPVADLEVAQALALLVELGGAGIETPADGAQPLGEITADGPVGLLQVDAREVAYLCHGEPETSQVADQLDAPQCGLIEQSVVGGGSGRPCR